jgi:cell division septation protein DedD
VEPIPETPKAAPVPPEVLVKGPEENGEPQGPWLEPIPEAPKAASVPPEVLVKGPEENGEPQADSKSSPSQVLPPQNGEESRGPGIFSVPVKVIGELEKGKYYVQLGAYRNAASVDSALLRIDPGYPLNIQNAGTGDNPVYRLLVGPLNLGESGALVQRFKGSGYRDAYVRTN